MIPRYNEPSNLSSASASAQTPDQLMHYVRSMGDVQSRLVGPYLVHSHGAHVIVVGYGMLCDGPYDRQHIHSLDEAVTHVLTWPQVERISIIAPERPYVAPPHAVSTTDAYYCVALPLRMDMHANARHMSHRGAASKDVCYVQQRCDGHAWTGAHQELMLHYVGRPHVDAGTKTLFQRLGNYCRSVPRHGEQVYIFSAYDTNGALYAFTIGDFTSLHTAFYMFSMRWPHAPAGIADTLLHALLREAHAHGYAQCNLGLGINKGITFFKKKWGGVPSIPYVQTSWDIMTSDAIQTGTEEAHTTKAHWLKRVFLRGLS